jgi:hypothetical protein
MANDLFNIELTEEEELFIDFLYNEQANPSCDPNVAAELAGLPKGISINRLMRKIKAIIQDDTQNYFLARSAFAAKQVVTIAGMSNPHPMADKVLAACGQILDRAGITKKDRAEVELKMPEGVIILPPLDTPKT